MLYVLASVREDACTTPSCLSQTSTGSYATLLNPYKIRYICRSALCWMGDLLYLVEERALVETTLPWLSVAPWASEMATHRQPLRYSPGQTSVGGVSRVGIYSRYDQLRVVCQCMKI